MSLFEPHVQWINKGKRHIDIGHPVLIASDQHHFILYHQVLDQGQADMETALPMAKELCQRYGVLAYNLHRLGSLILIG